MRQVNDNGPFKRGDEVKLVHRFAEALVRGRKVRTDWLERRGIVIRCSVKYVGVMWSGRRTLDHLPVRAVERI
ncbi:hypothetical protein OZ411_41765 [Bradyrhizobium sp. Arg237L]|uniref:hypothetical protein n=1 Tax=Bradyrhizobium sp. Arg237L TaxID=3003352 RepID=UPI00249E3BCB|nr:hypothetical protein [Bradyrhizobium sp. Arg237L]MDI4239320.1 hypothetical protein [Bradyrhizobium sp. Arg237L]